MIRTIIYDDHPQRCESLKALLSGDDGIVCVGVFHNCSQVLRQMEDLRPDIILMDIEMPVVDGISGVMKIKQAYPHIKIIMQTVFEDEEKIFASLRAGADGYILKNASADQVIQSILDVHQGGASMTPSIAWKVIKYFNQQPSTQEYNLTPKEKQVLALLAEGNTYKMTAHKLGITFNTVNSYIKTIYEKLQVHSVTEALHVLSKNKNTL